MSFKWLALFLVAILAGSVCGVVLASAVYGLGIGDEVAILSGVLMMWALCCLVAAAALASARWVAQAKEVEG